MQTLTKNDAAVAEDVGNIVSLEHVNTRNPTNPWRRCSILLASALRVIRT